MASSSTLRWILLFGISLLGLVTLAAYFMLWYPSAVASRKLETGQRVLESLAREAALLCKSYVAGNLTFTYYISEIGYVTEKLQQTRDMLEGVPPDAELRGDEGKTVALITETLQLLHEIEMTRSDHDLIVVKANNLEKIAKEVQRMKDSH
jgi:hypothetical protein